EGPVDYLADGGDDSNDEEESSEDDEDEEDDEMDVKADEEEEEEEHLAPADSIVVAPTAADQAPSAEEMEPFETDESAATPPPHPAYRTTARISMPAWTDSEVIRLLAISSPPASPLSPCPIHSLGYRASMIQLRDEATSTSHSPPLQLPSASRREDRPEVTLPPRKRLDIALGPRYEGAPVSTDTELGGYVRELRREDRRAHAYTRQLMETEARMSREAWVRATDVSDLVHGEVMSLRTIVLGQMSEIRELQAADRRRQTVISELLR
nr:hypothetical protein [Tanacetum cinerariifolium]